MNTKRITQIACMVVAMSCNNKAFAEQTNPFKAFIPQDWTLEIQQQGDLNNDGLNDAVLVLLKNDITNRLKNEGLGTPELNLNPRRLVILVNSKNGYQTVLKRDDLLPSPNSYETPCLADPLQQDGFINIKNGSLLIRLNYWLSCGSYNVSSHTYTFKMNQNILELIGYDSVSFSRAGGEEIRESYNLLTHKRKITQNANIFEDKKDKVRWSPFKTARSYHLNMMQLDCYFHKELICRTDN